MSKTYTVHEFAKLAGVTVRALHHYDRLGLLSPRRTASRYRAYEAKDLEKLEQIVALKYLGVPLKQIAVVLQREDELPAALRVQRLALEEKYELLGRTIRALREAEGSLASGSAVDSAILKSIIEGIEMQDGVAVMKRYYSEEAWERYRRYYEEGPSEEWQKLYAEGQALLGSDPESKEVQELADRWLDLSRRAHFGDPEALTDSPKAWVDRENWPAAMKERLAKFKVEEVTEFLKIAILIRSREQLGEETWARVFAVRRQMMDHHSRLWKERADLFHDIEKALGEDPGGERGKEFVRRWQAQLEEASGGDERVRQLLVQGWGNPHHWPEAMRWHLERLHLMSYERLEAAADFLERAIYLQEKGTMANRERADVDALLAEFDEEMSNTRRMLERVPDKKLGWKPAERGATLAGLASYVAFLACVPQLLIAMKVLDRPGDIASKAELLERFDRNVAIGRAALEGIDDARLARAVPVTPGVSKPLAYVLRSRMMNHLIHHRGQLSMYLRALGEPVPGMYGASADEKGG